MDGRFPITKAKSSHHHARKWETLLCYVKYTSCSLSVLTGWGVTGTIFRSSPSPQALWEGVLELRLQGYLPHLTWQHALLCPNVYLLLLQTQLLLPTASGSCRPSFGFPCFHVPVPSSFCILCWFPHHRLLSWFKQPARPTYHSPLPEEPGNLAPAHPAWPSLL